MKGEKVISRNKLGDSKQAAAAESPERRVYL